MGSGWQARVVYCLLVEQLHGAVHLTSVPVKHDEHATSEVQSVQHQHHLRQSAASAPSSNDEREDRDIDALSLAVGVSLALVICCLFFACLGPLVLWRSQAHLVKVHPQPSDEAVSNQRPVAWGGPDSSSGSRGSKPRFIPSLTTPPPSLDSSCYSDTGIMSGNADEPGDLSLHDLRTFLSTVAVDAERPQCLHNTAASVDHGEMHGEIDDMQSTDDEGGFPFRAGATVGPYAILHMIGAGSYGQVFLAKDTRRQYQTVALKMMPCNGSAGSPLPVEAALLKRLRHEHIVAFEDVQWDTKGCLVLLAMEFMDGGSLKELLVSRRAASGLPFESTFVRRVLLAVSSALQYIHSKGVLHRDVKPGNVLLSSDMQNIKLADFGISKPMSPSGHAHSLIGTPLYISPELAKGQAYGPAADAWAFGVMLYELAALVHPFAANSMPGIALQVCNAQLPPLPLATAPDIASTITGLLTKDPQKRLPVADICVEDTLSLSIVSGTSGGVAQLDHIPEDIPLIEDLQKEEGATL